MSIKKVIVSLAMFMICISVLGYMRFSKTNQGIDTFLVWLSLILLVITIFKITFLYRKKGFKIRIEFQIFKIIISFFTIYFSVEYLLKEDFRANLSYNLPLCLLLIIIGGMTFVKLEKKQV